MGEGNGTRLRERILEVVQRQGPLQGKEIAKLLGEDASAVNRVLYGTLWGVLQQGRDYRWSLPGNDGTPSVPPAPSLPLAAPGSGSSSSCSPETLRSEGLKLIRYYLACLSEGGDEGVSVFATSFSGPLDYHELPDMPLAPEVPPNVGTAISQFLSRGRGGNQPFSFRLGLPVLVVERTGRNGKPYRKIEPLLLWPFSPGQAWLGVPEGVPSLNPAAVASLSGSAGPEELEALTRELGLEEPEGQGPDLEDLLLRLRALRFDWPWAEEPDLFRKGPGQALPRFQGQGILNRAVLVAVGESRYTTGLREELGRLVQTGVTTGSCLGDWMVESLGGSVPAPPAAEPPGVLEILPLNLEQRQAIQRALREPLTVLTGPPGTGKSQVVTALLINAAHQGQRVLFASKNHQAVDVVETRVNGLSAAPVLLRLGARGDKHQALGDYLNRLLASSPGPGEQRRLEDAEHKLTELKEKLVDLEGQADRLVQARNTVDDLEQRVEGARTELGEERFRRFAELDPKAVGARLRDLVEVSRSADRSSQSWAVKLMWFAFQPRRLEALEKHIRDLRGDGEAQALLDLPLPAGSATESTPAELLGALAGLEERLELAGQARAYFRALSELQKGRTLEDLYGEQAQLREQLSHAAHEYWDALMAVRPSTLTRQDRKVLSDFAAVLALLARQTDGGNSDGRLWSQYYQLSQEAVGVLSCWAVTSLSARGRIPFSEGMFDLLVIDEASQCDIASALPLLFRARRAVIIGDPQQLRHISSLSAARDRQLQAQAGLGAEWVSWSYSIRSLFDLAQTMTRPADILMLRDHHRSHPDIIEFSNQEFYQGGLRVATRLDRLRLQDPRGPHARWIDVKGKSVRPPDGGLYNMEEAHAVVRELRRLVLEQGYPGTIGVVSPFRAQANRIQDLVAADRELERELEHRGFAADTVHRFQGDERDLMIFSPAISEGPTEPALGFFSTEPHLFNVAITRARACLLVVGDRQAAGRAANQAKYLNRFALHLEALRPSGTQGPVQNLGPEYPQVSNPHQVSDWERLLYRALYRADLHTIPQYPAEKYRLDLALIRGDRRLDIEVDGERYHRAWDGELLRQDQMRNARLMELGWDVMRFWVYQVRDDLGGCVARVREWAERG